MTPCTEFLYLERDREEEEEVEEEEGESGVVVQRPLAAVTEALYFVKL